MPPQKANQRSDVSARRPLSVSADFSAGGRSLRRFGSARFCLQYRNLADQPFDTLLQSADLLPILALVALKVVYDSLRGSEVAFGVAQGGAQSFAGLDKLGVFDAAAVQCPILFLTLPLEPGDEVGRSRQTGFEAGDLLAQPIAVASGMVRGFNRAGLPAFPRESGNLRGGLGEKELNRTGQGLWKCRRIAVVVGGTFCTIGEDGLDASDIAAAQAHSHPHRVQILAFSGKSLNGGGDVGIGVFLGTGHPDRIC